MQGSAVSSSFFFLLDHLRCFLIMDFCLARLLTARLMCATMQLNHAYILLNDSDILSFNLQLNIPVASLVSLVERVLAVNGSLPKAMSPFMTGIQQELVCAELPTLHSSALELLRATIKSIRR